MKYNVVYLQFHRIWPSVLFPSSMTYRSYIIILTDTPHPRLVTATVFKFADAGESVTLVACVDDYILPMAFCTVIKERCIVNDTSPKHGLNGFNKQVNFVMLEIYLFCANVTVDGSAFQA